MAGRHPAASTAGCSDFYGKLSDIETTGASERTAKPEGLSYAGVPASEKIAQGDLKNMEKYKEKIIRVANSKGIEPALVAAIISRESHAGTTLKNGEGDHGNGFGLMQVDKRYHMVTGAWDSEEHIAQGTDILCQSITQIQKKFPAWSKEQQLKGNMVYSWALITAEAIIMVGALNSNYDTNTAEVINAVGGGISAYNAGTDHVRTYERMDVGTTHDDYANDVVARAKFFQRNGY